MNKIKPLFKGRTKFNTLLLGGLPIVNIIKMLFLIQNYGWMINIPVALILRRLVKRDTNTLRIVSDQITNTITFLFLLCLLALFVVSCILYIKKRPKGYFITSLVQILIWSWLLGCTAFISLRTFVNISVALAADTGILAVTILLIINTKKIKDNIVKELEENEQDKTIS